MLSDEVLRPARAVQDPHVQPPADQPFPHVATESLADMQADAGIIAADPVKERLDQDHRHRRRQAQIDRADRGAPRRLQAGFQPVDLFEQGATVFEHRPAHLGQFGAPAVPPQKRRAAFRLKLADVPAERGLGNAQVAGGQREAAEFADTDEISEPLEVHGEIYAETVIADSPVLRLSAILPAP